MIAVLPARSGRARRWTYGTNDDAGSGEGRWKRRICAVNVASLVLRPKVELYLRFAINAGLVLPYRQRGTPLIPARMAIIGLKKVPAPPAGMLSPHLSHGKNRQ